MGCRLWGTQLVCATEMRRLYVQSARLDYTNQRTLDISRLKLVLTAVPPGLESVDAAEDIYEGEVVVERWGVCKFQSTFCKVESYCLDSLGTLRRSEFDSIWELSGIEPARVHQYAHLITAFPFPADLMSILIVFFTVDSFRQYFSYHTDSMASRSSQSHAMTGPYIMHER